MKKFTVCLYDGSVCSIDKIVATQVVEANRINDFDHIALFYDLVETPQPTEYPSYRNRITGKEFTIYYERAIMLSDKIYTYDFGSHSRFIAVVEGEYTAAELPDLVDKAYKK